MSLNLDEAWIRNARTVEAFTCDAVFATPRPDARGALSAALLPPARDLFDALGLPISACGELPSTAVIGHEESLIRYYEAVIAILTRLGEPGNLSHPFPYFAVQPSIRSEDVSLTRFSWLDSVLETVEVLTALKDGPSAPDGLLWDDVDQGWAAHIVRGLGSIVVVEWNWEDEADTPEAASFDVERLAAQAEQALGRLTAIHGRLVQAFGHDYWSYRPPASRATPRPNAIRSFLDSLRRLGRTP